MIVKVISVLGILSILDNIYASNCPKCGGKVKSRAIFDENDPVLAKYFHQSLIRPKMIQKLPYNLPLYGTPPKGPCSRRTAIVKPAIIPRPIYIQPDCKTEIGTNVTDLAAAAATAVQMLTHLSTSNFLNTPTVNLGPPIDVSKAYQQALAGARSTLPADAVSLALAYKMYQDSFNKKVSEDGLTYGFRKLPLEKSKPSEQSQSTLPEENLYSLNGPIVELTPEHEESAVESLSSEAMDELIDLACDTGTHNGNFAQRPSLTDLGYTPAKKTNPTFINIPPIPSPPASVLATVGSDLQIASETPVEAVPLEASIEPEIPDSPESSGSTVSPEIPGVLETPEELISQFVSEQEECEESTESPNPLPTLLPPPLNIEGFKPGNVVYKDLADSELNGESPDTEGNCKSQEEIVTHIPVPAPPCGCNLNDIFEGFRTYSRSKASRSGSRFSNRNKSEKKKKK